jgi:hypothetical protein
MSEKHAGKLHTNAKAMPAQHILSIPFVYEFARLLIKSWKGVRYIYNYIYDYIRVYYIYYILHSNTVKHKGL